MSDDPRNTPPPPDERDPHHELNNPAADPDPTEWPDPYDKREDPRDEPDDDGDVDQRTPRRAKNRRYQQRGAEMHDGWRAERGDAVMTRLRLLFAAHQRDHHEHQTGQGSRRGAGHDIKVRPSW